MRDILFRAKRDKKYCATQEWTYGVPFIDHEGDCIFKTASSERVVDPETVGQYIGLTDKNGKRIFDGDIVKGSRNTILIVFYDDISASFRVKPHSGSEREPSYYYNESKPLEIIGNIHDNPELL